MNVEPDNGRTGTSPFAGARTILVPPDIVAVTQRPKPPRAKKPAWRPRPDAGPTDRAGGRQWFGDRLFVEGQEVQRSGLSASIAVHVLVTTLAVVLAARFERADVIRVNQKLVMPAMLLMPPIPDPPSGGPRVAEHVKQISQLSEPAPAASERPPAAAPVEEPTSIEPETSVSGTGDGIEGGVPGGAGDGLAGATASSGVGVGPSGPLRLGSTVAPPKKIKDVRPVYPPLAVATQARGTVILDVTIGTDGKVKDAKVLHSVPHLDLAALEAVRQWEYEPTRINGALVMLIMTVVVNFAIQ